MLLVGAGVIGTVYGAQLGSSGHAVAVLGHGARADAIRREGLHAYELLSGAQTEAPAAVVERSDGAAYDLVLVALRHDSLGAADGVLRAVGGQPVFLFFGDNPKGHRALPRGLSGPSYMGFPGVGGQMAAGVANYVLIRQQPTALELANEPRLNELRRVLETRGFAVQQVRDMSGWLAYHAVFVASISAALYRCGTDPTRLAADTAELRLMCRAITDGFRALRSRDVTGLPRNLALLHSRTLLPIAVRYWARTMRTPLGELAFAAHCRHAEPEMRALACEVLNDVVGEDACPSLQRLLGAPDRGR